jgi:hypothetical protein
MRNLRYVAIVGLAWLIVGGTVTRADSLELLGAGPTGTVYLTAPTLLPAPYNGAYPYAVNVYAGVLDWTDTPGNSSPDYFTYCVDVNSVIYTGTTYNFLAPQAITSASLFSSKVINAVQNLWQDEPTEAQLVAGAGASPPALTGQQAAEFQIALWDIIYNGSSGTLLDGSSNTSPLYFSGDNPSGSISTALSWANQAYNVDTRDNSAYQNVDVMVATDGGQNQAIYISTMGPATATVVPLPRACISGVVLFGLMASAGAWRRMNKLAMM